MSPQSDPNVRKFERKLLALVLIPTFILCVAVIGFGLRERSNRIAVDKKADVLTAERLQAQQEVTEGQTCRGNLIKAYLRYRAQHLAADSDSGTAKRLFPILSPANQEPLSDSQQVDFIQKVINLSAADGNNPVVIYGCEFEF